MWIEIKPLDTLFFRDGKPFNAGEDTWANSMFPPNPSVIAGALFSAYLAEDLSRFSKDIPDDVSSYVKQVFIVKDDGIPQILVPAPLDIFKTKYEYVGADYIYKEDLNGSCCSFDYPILVKPNTSSKAEPLTGCFIELESLYKSYYYEAYENLIVYNQEDIYKNDNKIGIARSKTTHSSEEGKLYRFDSIQLEDDVSILVEFNMPDDKKIACKEGLLKIGGEGKTAQYKENILLSKKIDTIKKKYDPKILEQKQFRLLITSPTVFNNKWYPDIFNSKGEDGFFINTGNSLSLIASCVGKPVSLGGFNRKLNCPKTMKKAVPAGSVYTISGTIAGCPYPGLILPQIRSYK